jgi:hypothetical protein
MDKEDRGKILCLCWGSNPDRPVVTVLKGTSSNTTKWILHHLKCNQNECLFSSVHKRNGEYSGRKITASFGNVTVRGEKYGKGRGEHDGEQSV